MPNGGRLAPDLNRDRTDKSGALQLEPFLVLFERKHSLISGNGDDWQREFNIVGSFGHFVSGLVVRLGLIGGLITNAFVCVVCMPFTRVCEV